MDAKFGERKKKVPCFCHECNGAEVPRSTRDYHTQLDKPPVLDDHPDLLVPPPPPSILLLDQDVAPDQKNIKDFLMELMCLTTKHSVTERFITDLLLLLRSANCSFMPSSLRHLFPKSFDSLERKLGLR